MGLWVIARPGQPAGLLYLLDLPGYAGCRDAVNRGYRRFLQVASNQIWRPDWNW